MTSTLYEARAGEAKLTTCDNIVTFSDALAANNGTSQCGFVQLLWGYDEKKHALHPTEFGDVPFGSPLV